MPQITIDIATAAEASRIREAFCGRYSYETEQLMGPDGKPTGETKAAFTKRKLAQHVSDTVVGWEREQAQKVVSEPAEPAVS